MCRSGVAVGRVAGEHAESAMRIDSAHERRKATFRIAVHWRRRLHAVLGTDALNLAWSYACQGRCDRSDERLKILHPVRTRTNHHDAEGKSTEVVLVLEPSIHRQERIDLTRAAEQLAVLDSGPT